MNTRAWLLLSGTWLLVACTGTDLTTQPIIFNAEVAAAYQQPDAVLSERRSPLRLADGTTVTDCTAYLAALDHAPVEETTANVTVRVEYRICDTLAVLRDSAAPPGVALPLPAYAEGLRDRLDLRSFPSSLRQLADDYPTAADLPDPMATSISNAVLLIESADWHYRLEVVAVVGTDADAGEDWLVWLTDEALSGSYRDYRLLIISGANEPGYLTATVR
ncbi:hypothetical protein J2T57_000358 [Natronocella acetinitrilica]|uniref:Lipoprotein n=1 Tax=Natronocella acetinitrilica TaxID=414046 RepID=A0AAE3KAD7_9GAMM|nr:hypothetical protein [Natronocella acetinitrilica]MCP1673266.1 hypothetical protein [Natronocella acetinitrilica]